MIDSRRATGKGTRPPEEAQESGDGFRPDVPLAILESVRQHDRPSEVLEDEDLAASLPRRLGLTGVVESQMHRYRIATRRRERIPSVEVANLLRLVMRRPDCEPILREAGHTLARQYARAARGHVTGLARFLPAFLSRRVARRAVRRLLRRTAGDTPVHVSGSPLRATLDNAITARVDRYGIACILYAAAIAEMVHHVTGRRPRVEHVECGAQGEGPCVWELR